MGFYCFLRFSPLSIVLVWQIIFVKSVARYDFVIRLYECVACKMATLESFPHPTMHLLNIVVLLSVKFGRKKERNECMQVSC